jgi:hypothetical protein
MVYLTHRDKFAQDVWPFTGNPKLQTCPQERFEFPALQMPSFGPRAACRQGRAGSLTATARSAPEQPRPRCDLCARNAGDAGDVLPGLLLLHSLLVLAQFPCSRSSQWGEGDEKDHDHADVSTSNAWIIACVHYC